MVRNKFIIFFLIFLLSSSIASAAAPKVPVRVVDVKVGTVEINQVVNGQIEPVKNITISAKIGGIIQAMNVEVGQLVKAGQTLVVFEKDQIAIQIKQAEAAVELAKANLDLLVKGASEEDKKQVEAAVAQAKISYNAALKNLDFANSMFEDRTMQLQQLNGAKLQNDNAALQYELAVERSRQAQLAYDQAAADFTRMQELFNNQVITNKQFEVAQLQLFNAESGLNSAQLAKEQAKVAMEGAAESYRLAQEVYDNRRTAEQQVEGAKTQLELSKLSLQVAENNLQKLIKGANAEQVRITKASVKQAEAALELAKLQLENCTIKSPIAGVIAQVNGDPGEMVGPGVPLLVIISMEKVYAKADVTSEILQHVRIGDKVKVSIRGIKEERTGELELISPMADPRSQAFPIKVVLANSDYTIRPGMFADLKLTLRASINTVVIPVETVQSLDVNPYVYVIKDGKAVKRMIKVGLVNERNVEVLSGLSVGEKIAIRGQYSLKDGDQVEVIK